MSKFARRIFIIFLLIAVTVETVISSEGAVKYTAQELIEKIIESENKIKDVQADYLFYETDTNIPLTYAHWAYQADNEIIAGLGFSKAGSNLGYTISNKSIYLVSYSSFWEF